MNIAAINANGFALYNLGYLLLYPKYNCSFIENGSLVPIPEPSDDYDKFCTNAYFCEHLDQIHFSRNDDSDVTLNNWILKYDMDCYSKFDISLPGMMFFTGWTISSVFLSSLGDKYGRKCLYTVTLYNSMLSMIVCLLLPGHDKKYFYVVCATYFSSGFSTGGRTSTGYVFMTELLPEDWKNLSGTLWGIFEGSVYIYLTLYYRFFSKNWEPTFVFGALL